MPVRFSCHELSKPVRWPEMSERGEESLSEPESDQGAGFSVRKAASRVYTMERSGTATRMSVFPAFSQGFTAFAGCRESKTRPPAIAHIFSEPENGRRCSLFPQRVATQGLTSRPGAFDVVIHNEGNVDRANSRRATRVY
jgi:hypothetical protein